MSCKMIKDKKKTRIIEAFYGESAYLTGIKSRMCSHIILRLRSYFGHGDAVVGGREDDPFGSEGAAKLGNVDITEGVPRPRDQEAAIPLDAVETLEHDAAGARLQKWGTEEEKYDSSTSGGAQSSVVPFTPDSEPSLDWTDIPGPRPRRSGLEDDRRRRRTLDLNSGSVGGDRSSKAPEAGQQRERPKSMDGRSTGVAEPGLLLPSGRMSLQGSSTAHLEMDELTLAGSREPRRPSRSRRSDERG
ncbi:hypothetical protein FRC01_002333 [Tulasnella sp. 417]|nr:hypothetical protein FRC01_002333 [Tulasnella sp. 417]